MKYLLLFGLLLSSCVTENAAFKGTMGWSMDVGKDWERIPNAARSPGQFEGVTWKDKSGTVAMMVECIAPTEAERVLDFYRLALDHSDFIVSDVKTNEQVKGADEIEAFSTGYHVQVIVLAHEQYSFILKCQAELGEKLGLEACDASFRSFKPVVK